LSSEIGECSAAVTVAAGVCLVPVPFVTTATAMCGAGPCRMQDNTGKEKEGILDLGPGPGGRLLNPAHLDTRSKNSWKLQRLQVKTKDSIM